MTAYRRRRHVKRPPRRLAGCGHWFYGWRDRERCNACIRAEAEQELDPGAETWRAWRRRLDERAKARASRR